MTCRARGRRVAASLGAGLLATVALAFAGAQTETASTAAGGYAMHVHPPDEVEPGFSGGAQPIWQIDVRRGPMHRRLRYWRMQISGMNLSIPAEAFESGRVDLRTWPDHLRPHELDELFIYSLYGECGWPLPALAYMAEDVSQAGGPAPGWRTERTIVLGTLANGNPRLLPLRPVWTGLVVDTLLYATAAFASLTLAAWLLERRRRRRGRCRACGYDLRGIEGRCPECGAEAQPPRPAIS